MELQSVSIPVISCSGLASKPGHWAPSLRTLTSQSSSTRHGPWHTYRASSSPHLTDFNQEQREHDYNISVVGVSLNFWGVNDNQIIWLWFTRNICKMCNDEFVLGCDGGTVVQTSAGSAELLTIIAELSKLFLLQPSKTQIRCCTTQQSGSLYCLQKIWTCSWFTYM